MCAIEGGVLRSPCRAGVMARAKERHAYVDPKDIEELNITGTRIEKKREKNNMDGSWFRVQGPRFLSI